MMKGMNLLRSKITLVVLGVVLSAVVTAENLVSEVQNVPWDQRSWEDKVFQSTHDENYTFQNRGTYVLDPYIWAYTKEFAERFRMPREWIEPDLKGAYAVAWRMTTIGEIMCGHGGRADSCWKPLNCQMDIYYDNRIDLGWVTDSMRDTLRYGLSSERFLGLTPDSREKKIKRGKIMNSGGGGFRYGKYNQGGSDLARFDREIEPGVGLISYVGIGVCPEYVGPEKVSSAQCVNKTNGLCSKYIGPEPVQMIYENPQDKILVDEGKLQRKNVRPIHIITVPRGFLERANAAYTAQNKPNEDVMNNLIRGFFDSRKGNVK
jgi:hypothetical protein